MHFDENLDFYTRFFLEDVQFQDDSSIRLIQKRFLSSAFTFGSVFMKRYSVELGMEDQYFLTSSDANTVEVKKVNLPKINFSYSQNIYQKKMATIEANLSGRAFFPKSSPGLNTKLGLGAGAELEFKLMNQSFTIGYDYNVLKSHTNTTRSQNIFWNFTLEAL